MNEGPLTLAACGDILLHGRYQDMAERGEADQVFGELSRLLAPADLVVGNLETVLANGGHPRDDKLCLRGHPAYAAALSRAGFGILSLANNHCLDYGPDGLAETQAHLRRAGIAALGAGANAQEATDPHILTCKGMRLGFVAACHASTMPAPPATFSGPGIAPLEAQNLAQRIRGLKDSVDKVIALLHWGLEYAHFPTPEQVDLAHGAVDAGASLVLGHHSHAIQGIEAYGGGIIAYSLGNLTDADVDWQGPGKHYQAELKDVDRETFLLRLSLTPTGTEILDTQPLWLDDMGRPTPATGARAEKIERELAEYSRVIREGDLSSFWSSTVIESRVSGPLTAWWRSGSLWDKIKGFRPSQLTTLFLLAGTYLRIKLSRSESKWLLFNSRNDTRPMPAARQDDGEHR